MIGRPAVLITLGLAVGGLLSGTLVWRSTGATFTAATANAGHQWHSGQVGLTSAPSAALFALGGTNLEPGDAADQCIVVQYTGNVLATIRLYQSSYTVSALAQHIQMTVSAVTGQYHPDCSDFPDATTPFTSSSDLVWLGANASSWATGLDPWTASAATYRTYRFHYTLSSSAPSGAQSSTTGAIWTWEAQA